jgi:hypothetical protein
MPARPPHHFPTQRSDTIEEHNMKTKKELIVGAEIEPPRTAEGFITYLVYGFKRADHSQNISLFVDAPEYGGQPIELAQKLAGPDYCCHASQNCLKPIPHSAKNKLFRSDAELYAAAPELNPRARRRRASR